MNNEDKKEEKISKDNMLTEMGEKLEELKVQRAKIDMLIDMIGTLMKVIEEKNVEN